MVSRLPAAGEPPSWLPRGFLSCLKPVHLGRTSLSEDSFIHLEQPILLAVLKQTDIVLPLYKYAFSQTET